VGETAVTVIVPSYNSQQTVEKCLQALQMQSCGDYEIIVVDSSQDDTSRIIRSRFPDISLYSFPERKYPGEARNIGAEKAKGGILAFTDSDCIVDRDWVRSIVEAHKKPSALIGGVIDNGNPDSYAGWAQYFSEFSQWMPESAPGPVKEVAGGCMSIKKWAFEKFGPFPANIYSEDTALNWRLIRGGEKPLFIPDIKVRHINQTDFFRLMKKQVVHGRFFARLRLSETACSTSRRRLLKALSLLLPFLLFCRVCRRVIRNKIYVKEFILASPAVFILLISWSWGEFLGYSP
jgi:GT2 family glycosyltransferase